ncbi:MAG TPA: hypothetical protein VF310_14665, partial [Vicinamibacteria bacterium]
MPVSREDVQAAVVDLHQYLSDEKPPMLVAESMKLLLRCPPEYLAAQIHVWISGQALAAPVADYLF